MCAATDLQAALAYFNSPQPLSFPNLDNSEYDAHITVHLLFTSSNETC